VWSAPNAERRGDQRILYTPWVPQISHQFLDDRGLPARMPYLPDLDSICSRVPGLGSLLIDLDPTRPGLRRAILPGQLAWYAAACAAWVAVYLTMRGQPFVFRAAAGLVVIGLVVVGSYFRRRAGFRKGLRKVRGVMLDASLCPSCTHSLEGLPRHEDGCVVCPECGAAWLSYARAQHE
jgi:ribosomal protein L37AE/L43A